MRRERKSPDFPNWVVLTGLLVLADQGTKAAVRAFLSPGMRLPLIDGLVYLTYVQNYSGFSWFVPDLPGWVHPAFFILRLVILGLIFPVYAFYTQKVRRSKLAWIALGGISAGILGNLIDDLFFPFTTDFLQVLRSPSANLADLYAYTGVAAMAIETMAWIRVRKPRWRGGRHFLAARRRVWGEFWTFLVKSLAGKR